MSTETHVPSTETQPNVEEFASLSSADVAVKLRQCSAEAVEQFFHALIVRLDTLAERSDAPQASQEYDRVSAILDQVKERRGFHAMEETA
ncbi:MAG: hypothetical protein PHX87_01730 [Candidatus Peribacteraceae bacterium]|nr:hypothetical protein [Candidatus Peribacteraceae bacterium]MDD5742128.1 hypothetical protein [Candidatus Peribacteraceae bacterium]